MGGKSKRPSMVKSLMKFWFTYSGQPEQQQEPEYVEEDAVADNDDGDDFGNNADEMQVAPTLFNCAPE